MTDQSFLEIRRSCIGGSDAASLFYEGYGCLRRLFYSKRGVPEDFPIDDLPVIRRGHRLEVVAADEFAIATKRMVGEIGHLRHPDHPEIGVHLDREQTSTHRPDPGIVEIKCLGRETFSKLKREGIPVDYQMQVQHGLLVTGRQWGSFVAFWPDGFALQYWDIERDDEVCEMIRAAAVETWAQIHANPCEMPERLPANDKRCARCQWRRVCQESRLLELMDDETAEVEFDPTLAALAAEYEDAAQVVSEAEALKGEAGDRLKAALGERQAADTTGYRVYFRAAVRNAIDTAKLKKDLPDVAAKYNKQTTYRSLRVFARQ